MIIQICVGSSCYLKGSQDIVALFEAAVAEHGLDADVTLAGSFCTVVIDDTVHTGITKENFQAFFAENVLRPLSAERN